MKKETQQVGNNSNKQLFLYGLLSKVKVFAGWLVLLSGIALGFGLSSFIPFLIGLVLGVYLIYIGKAERFDFQRQSGTIIHKGDFR